MKWVNSRSLQMCCFLFVVLVAVFFVVPVFAGQAGVVVNAKTNVNLRSGPGLNYNPPIGQVEVGQVLTILEEKNDWLKVSVHKGQVGWIKDSYVNKILKEVTVTGSTVNLRSGPGLGYNPPIGQAKLGQVLSVIAEKDGWFKVHSVSTGVAWIASWYVKTNVNSNVNTNVNGHVLITTPVLNVRKGPGISYALVTKIGLNEKHNVWEENNGWYKIKVKNFEGWVSGDYVQYVSGDPPSRDSAPKKEVLLVPIAEGKTFIVVDHGGKPELVLDGWAAGEYKIREDQERKSLCFELQGLSTRNYEGKIERLGISQVKVYPRYDQALVELKFDFIPEIKVAVTDSQKVTAIQIGVIPVAAKGAKGIGGKVVVLDPGHASVQPGGGLDPGAVGLRLKLKEKDVNLAISLKVKRILEEAGARVVMTHTGRTELTLSGRAGIANDLPADIFVSIHADSGKPGIAGHTTYYYAPEWNSILGAQRYERQKLATLVQRELVKSGGRRDVGIREGNYAVLRETRVPSILVETAFLSDKEEEVLLAQDWYRQKIAEGIANGIKAYFD